MPFAFHVVPCGARGVGFSLAESVALTQLQPCIHTLNSEMETSGHSDANISSPPGEEEEELLARGGFVTKVPDGFRFPEMHHKEGFFGEILHALHQSGVAQAEARIQALPALKDEHIIRILMEFVPIAIDLAECIADSYRTFAQDLCAVLVGQSSKRAERLCVGRHQLQEEQDEGWTLVTGKRTDSLGFGLPARRKGGLEYIRVCTLEDAKRVTARLGVHEFHGTNAEGAMSIRHGIELEFGRDENELSPTQAFYTTRSLEFAIESAVVRSRQSGTRGMAMTGAVLLFSPGSELDALPGASLEPGISYQRFVAGCIAHDTLGMTPELVNAEWVRAPICKSTHVVEPFQVRWCEEGLQTAWRTPKAAEALGRTRSTYVLEISREFPRLNLM